MAGLLKRYFTKNNQPLNPNSGQQLPNSQPTVANQNAQPASDPTMSQNTQPVNPQQNVQYTPEGQPIPDSQGQVPMNQGQGMQAPPNQTAVQVGGSLPPGGQVQGAPGMSSSGQKGNDINFGPSTMDPTTRNSLSVISKLTQRSNQAILKAAESATKNKMQFIEAEHLLYGIIFDAQVFQVVQNLGGNAANIQKEVEAILPKGNFNGQSQFGPVVKQILDQSLLIAKEQHVEFISPEHILVALIRTPNTKAHDILQKNNVNEATMKQLEETGAVRAKESAVTQYGTDLTQMARDGKLDPITGRSAEIERAVHILSRRSKNNPVLIGEAGVGKTAIVEGLAQAIVKKEVPKSMEDKRVIALDLTSLVAGASHRGEFEERMRQIIREAKVSAGEIILFVDEIHNLVGAGAGDGSMQASNILKPALSRGEIQLVGATTIDEYRKYIEKDPALERRFQPVMVNEPSEDVAIAMLKILRPKYEKFHSVKILDEALEAAVKLSIRYVGDRFLPDKAVDLMDEAASAVKLPAIHLPDEINQISEKVNKLDIEMKEAETNKDTVKMAIAKKDLENSKKELEDLQKQLETKQKSSSTEVTKADIERIVASWTGIPVSRLTESESKKLLNLENLIHQRVVSQENAVVSVAEAIRRGRAGLGSNKRPIGSFLFLGPTGVGKTELAKSIAEILFGKEDALIRLDMSEYMEKHEVSKLIGAPPGYVGYEEGGQLTEAVRRKPYSVVLLDEVEKAHPDVFNILLQVLEDGRLTDNKGRTVSFKNTVIIATSNIGTKVIQGTDIKAFETEKKDLLTEGDKSDKDPKSGDPNAPQDPQSQDVPQADPNAPMQSENFQNSGMPNPNNPGQVADPDIIPIDPMQPQIPSQTVAPGSADAGVKGGQSASPDPNMTPGTIQAPQISDQASDTNQNQNMGVQDTSGQIVTNGSAPIDPSSSQTNTSINGDPNQVTAIDPTVATTDPTKEATPEAESVQTTLQKTENSEAYTELANKIMGELKKFFAPELINRFDEIVIFKPLQKEDMKKIVETQLKNTSKLLEEQSLSLEVTEEGKVGLADLGYDPIFGARPLRRLIQMEIENPISSSIIKGEFVPGDIIIIDYKDSQFMFSKKPRPEPKAPDGTVDVTQTDPNGFQANPNAPADAQSAVASEATSAPSDPNNPNAGQTQSAPGAQPSDPTLAALQSIPTPGSEIQSAQQPAAANAQITSPSMPVGQTQAPTDPIQNLQNMYGDSSATTTQPQMPEQTTDGGQMQPQ